MIKNTALCTTPGKFFNCGGAGNFIQVMEAQGVLQIRDDKNNQFEAALGWSGTVVQFNNLQVSSTFAGDNVVLNVGTKVKGIDQEFSVQPLGGPTTPIIVSANAEMRNNAGPPSPVPLQTENGRDLDVNTIDDALPIQQIPFPGPGALTFNFQNRNWAQINISPATAGLLPAIVNFSLIDGNGNSWNPPVFNRTGQQVVFPTEAPPFNANLQLKNVQTEIFWIPVATATSLIIALTNASDLSAFVCLTSKDFPHFQESSKELIADDYHLAASSSVTFPIVADKAMVTLILQGTPGDFIDSIIPTINGVPCDPPTIYDLSGLVQLVPLAVNKTYFCFIEGFDGLTFSTLVNAADVIIDAEATQACRPALTPVYQIRDDGNIVSATHPAYVQVRGLYDTLGAAYDDSNPLSVEIKNVSPTIKTYTGFVSFTPAANATDFFGITGANGKIIRIINVLLNFRSTAAALVDVFNIFRTVLNTGGTKTPVPATPMDTTNGAFSGSAFAYTANPAALGAGSLLYDRKDNTQVAATAQDTYNGILALNAAAAGIQQMITLRNVNEGFYLNFNGAAVPAGGIMKILFVITEEDG